MFEDANRLSIYKNLREGGVSKKRSAQVALNSTVNFYKTGEMGVWFSGMYAFYNAGAQGATIIAGAVKSKNVRRVLYATTGGAFLLAEMARMIGGDDEESGENFYETGVPAHVKRRNMVVMTGETDENGLPAYITLPLPYGYNIPHVVGVQMSNVLHGQSPIEAAAITADAILESFNPVGGSDSFLNQILPTWADPFADIEMNKDFAGRRLRPEDKDFNRVDTPDSELYFRNVNPAAKAFTKELNKWMGGDESTSSGLLDISPESLEHLGAFAVGAAGNFVKRSAKVVDKLITGEEIKSNEIPFARRFVSDLHPTWLREPYRKAAADVETRVAQENLLFAQDRDKEAESYGKEHEEIIALKRIVMSSDKILKSLYDENLEIIADDKLSPIKRERQLAAIEKERAEIYAEFLRDYKEATNETTPIDTILKFLDR